MSNYFANDHGNLRFKFKDSEKIQQNFSQAYQDLFVLSMLNGLYNGTYLEIGSNEPFQLSNTALLEQNYNWKGISIDIEPHMVNLFNDHRKNKAVCINALDVDYAKFINLHLRNSIKPVEVVDYLQVDCEPPSVTFEILQKILESDVKFRVITFEHESYYAGDDFKLASRILLEEKGYQLVVSDICNDEYNTAYEDWWVYPTLVDEQLIKLMSPGHFKEKIARDYILNSTNVWENNE